MNNGKLYIKGTCTVCRGKALGCYACDSDGLTYIEAADTIIIQWLESLTEERRNIICNMVLHEKK
jgi:hypothetical protein